MFPLLLTTKQMLYGHLREALRFPLKRQSKFGRGFVIRHPASLALDCLASTVRVGCVGNRRLPYTRQRMRPGAQIVSRQAPSVLIPQPAYRQGTQRQHRQLRPRGDGCSRHQ